MKQSNDHKKSEEQVPIIARMLFLLAAVAIVGSIILKVGISKEKVPEEVLPTQTETLPLPKTEQLTEQLSLYPKHVAIGQRLPMEEFYDADGKLEKLSDYRGKIVVLSFFASWCRDCEEQFCALGDLDAFFQGYPDVVWLPIDRLEEGKETQEMGIASLLDKNIQTPCLFDQNRAAYDALGGQMIPTTLFLDRQGRVQLCYAGVLSSQGQLASMISYMEKGRAADTEAFLCGQMMSEDGGVYTGNQEASGLAVGRDILSESQGLLMEYAMEKDDSYLFLHALDFVKKQMMEYPLPVWVLDEEQHISVNALLDDLRMLKALEGMQQIHGGYEDVLRALSESIVLYNIQDQSLVDFYDFSQKIPAERFTLCYADFKALEILLLYAPIGEDVMGNTVSLVEGGYISDEFPLYRNYYDYASKSYDAGSINMAEGLYTLYHLAEAGMLKETSLTWLHRQMEQGILFSRYDTDGRVVSGYDYESPAIYALTGLIALEVEDSALLTWALERLEQFRVFDKTSPLNGGIGSDTLEQMASYDQLMTLLLYAKLDKKMG